MKDALDIYLLYLRAGNSFLVALRAAIQQLRREK
jgi:hypothetical protein